MAKFFEGFKSQEEVEEFINRHFITTQDKANARLLAYMLQEGLAERMKEEYEFRLALFTGEPF